MRQQGPGACPKCGMALEPLDIGAALTKTEYTCPMHPEIIRDAPGACPLCGMALEARTVTLTEEQNPELEDMTRRFWVGAALSLPVLVSCHVGYAARTASPSDVLAARADLVSISALDAGCALVRLAVFRARVGVGGQSQSEHVHADRYRRGHGLYVQRRRDAFAGFVSSIVSRGHGGEVGVYFEAAAVITTLVLLGQVLELRARSKTSGAIRALLRPGAEDRASG